MDQLLTHNRMFHPLDARNHSIVMVIAHLINGEVVRWIDTPAPDQILCTVQHVTDHVVTIECGMDQYFRFENPVIDPLKRSHQQMSSLYFLLRDMSLPFKENEIVQQAASTIDPSKRWLDVWLSDDDDAKHVHHYTLLPRACEAEQRRVVEVLRREAAGWLRLHLDLPYDVLEVVVGFL